MSAEMRCCNKCGKLLPLTSEYFYSQKGRGFTYSCKSCSIARVHANYVQNHEQIRAKENASEQRKAYRQSHKLSLREASKKYRQRHPEKVRASRKATRERKRATRREQRGGMLFVPRSLRFCTACGNYLPETIEYFYRVPRPSGGYTLHSQCKSCRAVYRIKHYNGNQKKYFANAANRRARKKRAGGKYTEQDIKAQYKRQHGKCYWCDCEVGDKYHVDHVIPLARGGSNDPSNLVIACPACNMNKKTKLPWEWKGNKKGRMF